MNRIAIIGEPQSGKSSILKLFCHADPKGCSEIGKGGIANIRIPDERLEKLVSLLGKEKITYATLQFTECRGFEVEKRTVKLTGLNEVLQRNDALILVIPLYQDSAKGFKELLLQSLEKIKLIGTEFIIRDLSSIETRLKGIERRRLGQISAEEEQAKEAIKRVKAILEDSVPLRALGLTEEERWFVKDLSLLSALRILIVLNPAESQVKELRKVDFDELLLNSLDHPEGILVASVPAKIECEILELEGNEREEMLALYELESISTKRLIALTLDTLNLIRFYTVEGKETRSWLIPKGATAVMAAGSIHTDMEKGFIRGEAISFDELVTVGSMQEAHKVGKIRSEGKSYVVQDGDVLTIRFKV